MKEVHSWCVHLDVPYGHLFATLTDDERQRYARFQFERDQRRFVVSHAVLRGLLGSYLAVRPDEIRFVQNPFGKPRLSPAFGSRLRFNLTHSADLALIAVAFDAEVGVDVEYVRALPELTDNPHAFLESWTKREAFMKAAGLGLAADEDVPEDGWSFFFLQPVPGFVGSLVVQGTGWRLISRTARTDMQAAGLLQSRRRVARSAG